MWTDSLYRQRLVFLKPLLELSIDPVCVVNEKKEVVYMDLAMKSLLGLKGRELRKRMIFCDLLKLPICSPKANGECRDCQIDKVIKKAHNIRIDEVPATRGTKKLRVSIKASAIHDAGGKVIGAVISVRDTSGEVLLQAKYHKILDVLKVQEQQIHDLEEKVHSLYSSLRRARNISNI